MQRKIQMWNKNGKMMWWVVGECTGSGDSVAGKELATLTELAESLQSSAFPFLPWDQSQNLAEKAEGELGGQEKKKSRCSPPEK